MPIRVWSFGVFEVKKSCRNDSEGSLSHVFALMNAGTGKALSLYLHVYGYSEWWQWWTSVKFSDRMWKRLFMDISTVNKTERFKMFERGFQRCFMFCAWISGTIAWIPVSHTTLFKPQWECCCCFCLFFFNKTDTLSQVQQIISWWLQFSIW